MSNFKLKFDDGSSLTIQQAISDKYIEPLVIASSSCNENKYMFQNFYNITNGGSTTGSYSSGSIFLKVKNKSPLVGYSLNLSVSLSTVYEGICIYEFSEDTRISLSPLSY